MATIKIPKIKYYGNMEVLAKRAILNKSNVDYWLILKNYYKRTILL